MTAAFPPPADDGGQRLIVHNGRPRIAADVEEEQRPKPKPPTFDERRLAALDVVRTFVELDRVLLDLRIEYGEQQRAHQLTRQALDATREDNKKLTARLWNVMALHGEHTTVTCGDGCCGEGTGVCGYCNEPWPCTTYRTADKSPPER